MSVKELLPRPIRRLLSRLRAAVLTTRASLFRTFFRDYSQAGETIAVRRILKDHPNKTFVEIGANDGITFSATLGLLEDGWSGWSVEANPTTYAKLTHNLAKFPKSKQFNIAIAPEAGRVKLYLGKDDPEGLYATLSEDRDQWYEEHRSSDYVEVEGLRLSQFLDREGIPADFGLLLVDTEGMDLEILKTLDTSRHKPRLIVTEDYQPKNDEKFALLSQHGYRFLRRVGCNTFWISSG